MKKLVKSNISTKHASRLVKEDYSSKERIVGVEFLEIKNFVTEDGSFSELVRFTNKGCLEGIPDFKAEQINYSLMLPESVKAWHLHFNQEDVWYVPPKDRLLVGLVDLRKGSKSESFRMKFVMGGGKSQLLYIPRGVAHGVANPWNKEARIIYFVNQKFNINDNDEGRLPWDEFDDDFWTPKKG